MVTDILAAPQEDASRLSLQAEAPASLPEGQRIYAVGDVHGCADRLRALHTMIAADLGKRPIAAPLLVHIGDYIDRGPDSAGVIETLRGTPVEGVPTINLMGNHEAMMLEAMSPGSSDAALHWLDNGGDKSLQSWGLSPSAPAQSWKKGLPDGVEAFLQGLALRHQVGPYLFVHAGLRPGVPLAKQTREDMLWIRGPFLRHEGDLRLPDAPGLVVVHGHTPMSAPVVLSHRIDIDTGAVVGGPLTCLVLEADRLGFLFG
jgi:serine/threonine protein phosphatase 1